MDFLRGEERAGKDLNYWGKNVEIILQLQWEIDWINWADVSLLDRGFYLIENIFLVNVVCPHHFLWSSQSFICQLRTCLCTSCKAEELHAFTTAKNLSLLPGCPSQWRIAGFEALPAHSFIRNFVFVTVFCIEINYLNYFISRDTHFHYSP